MKCYFIFLYPTFNFYLVSLASHSCTANLYSALLCYAALIALRGFTQHSFFIFYQCVAPMELILLLTIFFSIFTSSSPFCSPSGFSEKRTNEVQGWAVALLRTNRLSFVQILKPFCNQLIACIKSCFYFNFFAIHFANSYNYPVC